MKNVIPVMAFVANVLFAPVIAFASSNYDVKTVKEEITPDAIYVKESYRVAKDDTLDSIADRYMKKNTYGKREHNEFKQGIVELNKWPKFFDLKEGDMLVISYWKNRG